MTKATFPVTIVQDAPTEVRGHVLTLRAGELAFLNGGPPGRHRKYIRITNEDVNTRLYLVAGPEQDVDPITTTVKLATIGIDDFIELYTNGQLVLKNIATGETVTPIQIVEVFYV
jgi:hypothetical protein